MIPQFLVDAHDAYFNWLTTFKGEPVRLWMNDHLELPVIVVALYMVMVLWVPENFMKNRKPYNLKLLNTIWNLLLSVFSITGAYYCLPVIYKSVFGPPYELEYESQPGVMEQRVGSVYMGVCKWNGNLFFNNATGAYVMMFILSKIPEMLDTAFLVFQKKNFIFLHWYHHITVMLYCWHSYIYHIGSGLVFAGMNYGVHSVMYSYYFVCALGYRHWVRPIAPYITMLQIIQMVIGLYVELYSLYQLYLGKGCDSNKTNIRLGTIMYLSYFILFTQMYLNNYIFKKRDKDRKPRVSASAPAKADEVSSSATNGTTATKKNN